MYDVAFFEVLEEEEKYLRKHLDDGLKVFYTYKTIQAYNGKVSNSNLISVRTKSIIPNHWHNKISGVLTRTTGYNHLLSQKSISQGELSLGYLPSYCSRSVAEHSLMLILVLIKRFKNQVLNFNSFNSGQFTGQDCQHKNIFIVGVGNIGYELAKLCRGLQMNVCGYDILHKYQDINYVPLDEGLKNADIVVSSLTYSREIKNFFNYELLKKAKRGSFFINISRGELSSIQDLARLIDEGHLGGLAMDVFENETKLSSELSEKGNNIKSDYSQLICNLSKKSNVVFTPHNAFNTSQSIENKSRQTIEQVYTFLQTGKFKWEIPGIQEEKALQLMINC